MKTPQIMLTVFATFISSVLGFSPANAFDCQGPYCLQCPIQNIQDDIDVPFSLRAATEQFNNKQEVVRFCRENIYFEKTGPFVLKNSLVIDHPEDQDSDGNTWNFILNGKVGDQAATVDATQIPADKCAFLITTPLVLLKSLIIKPKTCELAICIEGEGSFDHENVKILAQDHGDDDGDWICKSYSDPQKKADNCPGTYNPNQKDFDQDGIGDACDFYDNDLDFNIDLPPDDDEDGKPNAIDNCPKKANPDQKDQDSDKIGDACDPYNNDLPIDQAPLPDDDGDGVPDLADNCPKKFNPLQADEDKDDIGDVCDLYNNDLPWLNPKPEDQDPPPNGEDPDCPLDSCPYDSMKDEDQDGVLDLSDNCPKQANPLQENEDQDAWGNVCDPLPHGSQIVSSPGGCQLNTQDVSNRSFLMLIPLFLAEIIFRILLKRKAA